MATPKTDLTITAAGIADLLGGVKCQIAYKTFHQSASNSFHFSA